MIGNAFGLARPSRWLVCILVALSLLLSATLGRAQTATDSHTSAAAELLDVLQVESQFSGTRQQFLALLLQQQPQLASYQDILVDFLEEFVSWESLEGDYIALYKKYLTEEELREITAFYRTETGQKFVTLTPQLTLESAALAQRRFLEHRPELERRLQERFEQLQGT